MPARVPAPPPRTPRTPRSPRRRRGFTLVELIVVLSIIVIASAITFPFIGAMTSDLASSGGLNTVQAATMAARAYATRDKSNIVVGIDPITSDAIAAEYSGAAALFTPANRIRLVENAGSGIRLVDTGGEFIETFYESDGIVLNGFSDIVGREPIELDPNAGVVGIVRTPTAMSGDYPVRFSGENTALIPPPFAVWFSQSGGLVAGVPLPDNPGGTTAEQEAVDRSRNRVLYYRYDDGNIATERVAAGNWAGSGGGSQNRANPDSSLVSGGTYDADAFDPASGQYDAANAFDTNLNRETLPFEEIEAVVGVIVYDKSDFRAAGFDWPANATTGPQMAQWLTDNGTAVFFSPTSGVAFREAEQQ